MDGRDLTTSTSSVHSGCDKGKIGASLASLRQNPQRSIQAFLPIFVAPPEWRSQEENSAYRMRIVFSRRNFNSIEAPRECPTKKKKELRP